MKRVTDPVTKRETITRIHEGIVIQDCGTFARVYNNAPRDKGGDVSPETCEMFPILSPACWMEVTSEKDVDNAFPIPPVFRFK
jgi:hypothetical protein